MKRYGADLCQNYTITWFDRYRIELRDKKMKQMMLVANEETPLSEHMFFHYDRLKEELSRSGNNKERWRVDVRFKNQMVLSAQKGERT